jgi:hypothetical protein
MSLDCVGKVLSIRKRPKMGTPDKDFSKPLAAVWAKFGVDLTAGQASVAWYLRESSENRDEIR